MTAKRTASSATPLGARPTVSVIVNGAEILARNGSSVAAALLSAGITHFRTSERGEARAPVCGMGICFECRVTIGGEAHQRACLVTVREGMTVVTSATA